MAEATGSIGRDLHATYTTRVVQVRLLGYSCGGTTGTACGSACDRVVFESQQQESNRVAGQGQRGINWRKGKTVREGLVYIAHGTCPGNNAL